MNRIKATFYLVMIILGLLAFSNHLANAQTTRYWTACGVLHEDGRQCFEEVVINLDSLKSNIWNGDSIIIRDKQKVQEFGWITDSITWVATDATFEGDCKCEHEWVYSEPYSTASRVGELVYRKSSRVIVCVAGYHLQSTRLEGDIPIHDYEEHCYYEDSKREKICKKCLFSVIEREKWSQHFIAPPKSEFELLKEKQRVKR